MWTILLLEGKTPRYCIGLFDTMKEAEAWAKEDGWAPEQFKVIRLYQ